VSGLGVMFRVPGLPIPQGHVRSVTKGGRTWSFHGSPGLKPWRESITLVAVAAMAGQGGPYTGAVEVALTFHLPRPRSHYGTGRNATRLKASAPEHVTTRPDVDRLARAVLDAISIGPGPILADDSQVAVLYAAKRWTDGAEAPGVSVFVADLAPGCLVSPFQVDRARA
jgi:Holliday junction resolvase RusA-like endonuclease